MMEMPSLRRSLTATSLHTPPRVAYIPYQADGSGSSGESRVRHTCHSSSVHDTRPSTALRTFGVRTLKNWGNHVEPINGTWHPKRLQAFRGPLLAAGALVRAYDHDQAARVATARERHRHDADLAREAHGELLPAGLVVDGRAHVVEPIRARHPVDAVPHRPDPARDRAREVDVAGAVEDVDVDAPGRRKRRSGGGAGPAGSRGVAVEAGNDHDGEQCDDRRRRGSECGDPRERVRARRQ